MSGESLSRSTTRRESTSAAAPRFAYHGRYLRVDLTRASAEPVPLDDSVLRRFLGGSGLGAYLMLRERAAECEPLAPEAPLAFVFSPLVGSPLTTSAKFAVVSKSPLTGRLNDSLASSRFAIAGKRTGFDAIVLRGRASRPSVLLIDDGEVRLEDADDVWGATCSQTQATLRSRFGADWSTAVIGPAGENRVRFATISHDGRHAGRGGSGAVFGAKNLKAILVRGSQLTSWAEPAKLIEWARELSRRSFGPATAKYRELGTASNLLVFNRLQTLPTRNFQQASFAEAPLLAPEELATTREKVQASCAACTIGCEHLYSLREAAPGDRGVRLEYENLFALGPLCGISDPDIVLRASQACDEWGLDTISAGGTIAFAMECVERGLLDASWLKFGDGASLLEMLRMIACREGLGDRLAEGSRRFAEELGSDSLAFAPQIKGLEMPGYEPRSLQTLALGLAVGTRGADHNRSGAYEADFSEQADRHHVSRKSASLALASEDRAALLDSLILCKFLRGVFEDFYSEAAEMLRLVTGWDVGPDELKVTAQRIQTAKKWFNIQAGWTPSEDTLPERFFQEAPGDDPAARLSRADLVSAIVAYNRERGWSDEGWIEHSQLERLGLTQLD